MRATVAVPTFIEIDENWNHIGITIKFCPSCSSWIIQQIEFLRKRCLHNVLIFGKMGSEPPSAIPSSLSFFSSACSCIGFCVKCYSWGMSFFFGHRQSFSSGYYKWRLIHWIRFSCFAILFFFISLNLFIFRALARFTIWRTHSDLTMIERCRMSAKAFKAHSQCVQNTDMWYKTSNSMKFGIGIAIETL